tara:strand:- start:14177 stop:15076 length:900 start_codon:yes stop_codon:yes gene_type:complete
MNEIDWGLPDPSEEKKIVNEVAQEASPMREELRSEPSETPKDSSNKSSEFTESFETDENGTTDLGYTQDDPTESPSTLILGEPWICDSCGKEEVFNDETCTFCGKDRKLTEAERIIRQPAETKDTYFQAVAKLDLTNKPEPVDPEDEPSEQEKKALEETEVQDAPDGMNEAELYAYWVSKETELVVNMSHEEIQSRIILHMTNQRVLLQYMNRRQKKSRAQEFADRLMYREIFEKLPEEIRKNITFEADIQWKPKTKSKKKKKSGTRARSRSNEEKLYDSLVAIGIPGAVAREKSGWAG